MTIQTPAYSPDPTLTANVYCAGQLEAVICLALASAWPPPGRLEEEGLWIMRYARCGEHIKIRVHTTPSRRTALRFHLQTVLEDSLANLKPPEPGVERYSQPLATPIDLDDRSTTDYPDRTLLWTTYERSAICFGPSPLIENDGYISRLARCLSQGTEIVLRELRIDGEGGGSPQHSQRLLLKALISGLAQQSLSERDRTEYLIYHRDWLIRAAFRRRQDRATKAAEALQQFEDRRLRMGEGTGHISRTAAVHWLNAAPGEAPLWRAWNRAIGELIAYPLPEISPSADRIDPFANHSIFIPLFKVFHGLANQLGLRSLEEAFVHHLLARTTTSDPLAAQPVRMLPDFLSPSSGRSAVLTLG